MAMSISGILSGPPAIQGGSPAFPGGLQFVKPTVPPEEAVLDRLRTVLATGVLTNGPFVRELEEKSVAYLGARQCVAVASCTAGLMLVLRASELSGDVVLPSFTFAATAHAVAWNQLRPVFADIDPETLTLSPQAATGAIGVRTSAILATHTFGTPCDVEGLTAAARSNGIKLFFDAAHAFGSRRGGTPVGRFGDAEVFSLSPTKVLVAAEGGIIATNDDLLAERCRIGRDYANPGDYDCRFVGLNARMSEVHAAIALASLEGLDERIERRNQLVATYQEILSEIPGVSFPSVAAGDRSTYKDFTILIDPDAFGIEAAELAGAYRYLASSNGGLPITERASTRVLTLPLWGQMTEDHIGRVVSATARIQRFLGGRKLRRVDAEKIRHPAEEHPGDDS
jgi:dTDP-4-amino-4,6-dideoxygalactose transaminase